MTKTLYSILLLLTMVQLSLAQKQVALTIDDVPNATTFKANNFESRLLQTTDSLHIPVTIFIREGYIYDTEYVVQNFELLNEWIQRDYVTPGNHSFSHLHYSAVGFQKFTQDIVKGEAITRELVLMAQKELKYFRFPYNDLGADSEQHDSITQYLFRTKYIIAPFTIESSDYIFNSLYEYYRDLGQIEKADSIAHTYVNFTLTLFEFFEELSKEQFNRPIKHIYLCHDSPINAKFLPELVDKLRSKGYSFISLDEALKDPVYESRIYYKGKWGFSWVYRWMNDPEKRTALMKKEPFLIDIYEDYKRVNNLD